jgi:D-3-phosphoglycerate dehydrogenase
MASAFRIAISRDLLAPPATVFANIGLDLLKDVAGVEYEFLAEDVDELRAGQLSAYDALLLERPRLTAESLRGAERLAVVARFGVGYDNVDVAACTENGTLLAIASDAVRRPMAVAALTLVLALSQRLLEKDRLTRAGRWYERDRLPGVGLVGRTLGVIGLGNVGRELMRLAEPYGLRRLAYDPYVKADEIQALGVEPVGLETLLRASDFVVVLCALTPETHGLLDAERLALLKPSAYLVNIARGPIVHQLALTRALVEKAIAGAALDVFDPEPLTPDDPLVALDNVILTPHAICSTDECWLECGRSALRSILAVATGDMPDHVVNPEALDRRGTRVRIRQ